MEKEKILLEVKNLSVSFNSYLGIAQVLNNINFEIYENSWFGFAGESGCGKTVTGFSILRLLPESAEIKSGKILFKNKNLLELNEKEMFKIRGADISMVFQDPQSSLNPSMKIGEHLYETLLIHNQVSKKEAKRIILEMLDKVKMPLPEYRLRQYPHELSGGMQQRIFIAMALLCNPRILIADEFTTNLDVTIQDEIIGLVIELQKEFKMSVMFITHDLALVSECCDYIAIMYAGQIVEKGRVRNIFSNPSHPYTKALLEAIPSVKNSKKTLLEINGFVPNLINPPSGCRFNTRCSYMISNVCNKEFPKKFVIEEGQEVWCHLFD